MKIALVHDYLSEFGGAERVLKTLSEMYPSSPIYTAFRVRGSQADIVFGNRKVQESWLAPILRVGKLYSPLRFLAPLVWSSLDLKEFDIVIASSSWFITRGFKVEAGTKVICYCHTPPRYLYGYETSINLGKYLPVKVYSAIVNHFLRIYDFYSAQKVNQFIANSENVSRRIEKFYRKDSIVIYPPVEVNKITKRIKNIEKSDFYLIVSRLVGAKGIEEAVLFAQKTGIKLKIVGESAGFSQVLNKIKKLKTDNIELLGRVGDDHLFTLYAQAKGFIALAKDEDFGMTAVEAQAAGTPVIAYNGGGFRETVIDGKTGILINDTSLEGLENALARFNRIKWDKGEIQKNAKRFSREIFERSMEKAVKELTK